MKNKGSRVIVMAALLSVSSPIFAEITVETDAGPITPPANPVAELRNHDDAFALLIECFRQLQTGVIEANYENRLAAADKLADVSKRDDVLVLVKQERDLRFEKLESQMTSMSAAYHYARKTDEREAGTEVAMHIDTAAAAKKLENFVAIVPAPSSKDDIVVTRIIPANLILRPKRSEVVQQVAAH